MKKSSTFIDLCYVLILIAQFILGVFWLSSGQANADELSAEQPSAIGPGPTSTIEGIDLEESIRTPGPIEAPAPFAPGLGITIEGINFDEDAANNSGFYHIPPDPIGAAGPDHLVSVVNTSIEWHTKAGVQQTSQSLASFFSPLTPLTGTFDPKVIYDQFEDRFLVVALEIDEVAAGQNPGNVSSIFVAVSADSNPNGTWHYDSINAKEVIGASDHWADYPGFAVDEEAVYITASMFSHVSRAFGGTRLWIIDKGVGSGGFYDGGAASTNRFDFPSIASTFALTTQPAHILGTPPPGNVGTFLVQYSGLTNLVDEFLNVIRVDDPLGSTVFSPQLVNIGNIDNAAFPMPNAPQNGTATQVETNDRRALNAVWRANSLWTTAQIVPGSGSDAGQATAHWWEIDTTTLSALSLVQQGDVGGEDIAPGTHTFFPSIAVDQNGNMGIGFAASAASIFPGAYYTGQEITDPIGSVQPVETLAAGLDFYVRTFGGPRNRWGDYSGISIDPSDGETFWVFNEYALERGTALGGEDGRWGTRFGSFTFAVAAPCDGDFEPADSDVDDSDLAVFAADFGRTNCNQGDPCEGDFDRDNDADGSDLAVFIADFGRTDCPLPD
jgi:hypothetical protein